MSFKHYCIICGKPFETDDPEAAFCPRHAGQGKAAPITPKPDQTAPEPGQGVDLKPGQTLLDTYQVIGLLGEGGMGKVYRVHHNGWNMDMAVKQPKPEMFKNQKRKADFIREAETWVDLGLHPHIASCFYVRTIGQVPHIFVEYMAGGSLEDWIQRDGHDLYAGSPEETLARILDIAIQFAWGLGYAHEQGLVHQDVKPLNVLMTPEGIVKVTDFGLAKARAVAGETPEPLPSRALVSGSLHTVPYRSPEQARGDLLDHKTDIWSWAVSVLEMFTGGVFWMDGQAAGDILEGYLQNPKEEYIPAMPGGLVDLLQACFQKEPGERPDDMAGIAEELIRVYQEEVEKDYPRKQPKAVELRADSLNNTALSKLDLGKSEEAEALLEQAVAADSQHVAATYNLGLLRWRSGRMADVDLLQKLKQIQEDQPEDGGLASALGWVCLESGRFGEALAYFEQAVRLEGDSTSAEGIRLARPLSENGAGGCLRTIEGHTSFVHSVAISPDGRWAISCNEYKIKLWDLHNGACLRTFEGHTGGVTSVAFSPDGRWAISGSSDKTLKLWDLATGACLRTFEGHTGFVRSVAISPDGRRALSGSKDQTLKLWDLENGTCLRTFMGHKMSVNSVAFSPDGRCALSGSVDKTLKLWDLATGDCLRTFVGHTDPVNSVAISPDGREVLSGSDDGTLKLWDLAGGACLRTFEEHMYRVTSVAFSPDGHWAISNSGYTLKLWDLATGQSLRTFEGHSNYVESIAFSPDGRRAFSGSYKTLKLWDLAWVEEYHHPAPLRYARGLAGSQADKRERNHAAYLQQGRQLLSQGKVSDALEKLEQAREVPGFERATDTLALSANLGDRSRITGFKEGWLAHTFDGHTDDVLSVAISPDGHRALSGSYDQTLKLWDLETGACLRTIEGHVGQVISTTFSPDGRRVLSGSVDNTVKMWDLHNGACLLTFKVHNYESMFSLAISPDVRQALIGRFETLKLWNLQNGACLRTLEGHTGWVSSVAFSPDGRWALSGSDDNTLKLWDLAGGACLRIFEGHRDRVLSVAFGPDGRRALSGSGDGTLKLWNLVWEYEFPGWADWDEGARPYLENFLTLHTPYAAVLPQDREPTEEEIRLALTHRGKPTWTEDDFQGLLTELGQRGYGWLREEGVHRKLEEMARERG